MNIRKRFIIFSIVLGIVPVIISTSLSIANFNSKNVELIKDNVIATANHYSMNLEYFFKQNESDLNITTNIPVVKELLSDSNNKTNSKNLKNNTEVLNKIFVERTNEQDYLCVGALINNEGIVIASSDDLYLNQKDILSTEELERLSNNQVVVTNIIERESFNNGIKSAIIAKPIFFRNKYQGALISVINMKYFENIKNSENFFKSGKMIVTDENGVIACSTNKDVTKNINQISKPNNLYEQWEKIDFNSNPKGVIEYTINGTEKIGYYSKIGDTNWIVLSGAEWAEFKEPIYKIIRNIIMFLIFIIIVTIVSYTFTINHFSKPIYKLLEAIRKIKQGDYKDRFIYSKDNEFGEIATAFNDLIDTVEKNKKHIEDQNRDLQSITSNIPGGVYRCKVVGNKEHILDFVSDSYLNILGYEKNEYEEVFQKQIINLIYEQDRERVAKEIKKQLSVSNKYTIEYRAIRKDGNIIWLLDNGQTVKIREGEKVSYSVVINITEAKITQEKLRRNEERYKIIMSQTEDIIFEWNIKEDTVSFSENWKKKFDYESILFSVSSKIYNSNVIHEDDIKKFGKILNNLIYGDIYQETEIRCKNNNHKFIWCKIRMTAMFDESGNVFRVIGAIIDIDKPKREAEKLLFSAQRDSLTHLYNKGTVESMIKDYVINDGEDTKGALFMIDVDNFKDVNDNFGHLAGDFVLSSIASMLSEVFYENSIIGRIGGDEFVVFLKNIDSEEFLYKKADELVEGFRLKLEEQAKEYNVSGSVGIAKYPEHGDSFKELFKNADKAVYIAKHKGKNNYCVFEEI